MNNKIPKLVIDNILYGSHEIKWDLSILLYKGSVLEPRRLVSESIANGSLGQPILERLKFILQYAIVYVEEEVTGKVAYQKHIMRYPQLFATQAIATKIDAGQNKGIIWHTQGSGKTALAYLMLST